MIGSIANGLPTTRTVDEAGSKFKFDNWTDKPDQHKHLCPDIERLVSSLGLVDGQNISRQNVRNLVRTNPESAVILTIVWGYPTGTINGHRRPVERAFQCAADIAGKLSEIKLRDPMAPNDLISEINDLAPSGIGTSTTSKWAYFFEITTTIGDCLIYDHRVINCIMEGIFAEFLPLQGILPSTRPRKSGEPRTADELRKSAISRQPRTYESYLRAVYSAAHLLGQKLGEPATGAQIELGLFGEAPSKGVMAARTKARKKASELTA
jgi:hypothetical protein